jgi:hypothetical protein
MQLCVTIYISAATNASITQIHPIFASIIANTAERIGYQPAGKPNDGGTGALDMWAIQFWFDTEGHDLSTSLLNCVKLRD